MTLAPVYLDNQPVRLMGDPSPQVAKVIAAMGKHPERFDVRRLDSPLDAPGNVVDLEDILDRTAEPTKPIYLTTVEKASGLEGTTYESAETPSDAPGVSGQGNAAGSPQSAYSRTGTDTAEPGMVGDFGSGAAQGISSMTSAPTPNALPDPANAESPQAVPALVGDFGKEGLHGKQGQGPTSLHNGLKTDVGSDPTAPSGKGSETAPDPKKNDSEVYTLGDAGKGTGKEPPAPKPDADAE